MPTIAIEDITAGMTLAEDLMHLGRMLLPAGTVITDNHISILKRQGVESCNIQGSALGDPDEETIEKAFEYTREFFMYVDHDHPLMGAIFDAAVKRTALKLMQGWTIPTEEQRTAVAFDNLRDLFYRDEGSVDDVVNAEVDLASFPDIFLKINEVLSDPKASSDDVARIVSMDVGFSAKLLRLVNSAMYGFPSKIESISRAVTLVGGQELSTLALGLSAISYFKDIPPELIEMKTFWKHSLSCGIFAKILANEVPGISCETLFTAGLLHDVGRLVLYKKMPYASVQAMLYARENFVPQIEAEDMCLGFNHTDIASVLLKRWGFPDLLTEIISHHHSSLNSSHKVESAILQVSDNLANAVGIADGGMYVMPGIDAGAWEMLSIDIENIPEFIELHDVQINELMKAFFG